MYPGSDLELILNSQERNQERSITKQLQGQNDAESVQLKPVNLGLPSLKELGAKWLVEMAEYIANNPQFIVNGFVRAGISGALDGYESAEEVTEPESDNSESDDYSEQESEL